MTKLRGLGTMLGAIVVGATTVALAQRTSESSTYSFQAGSVCYKTEVTDTHLRGTPAWNPSAVLPLSIQDAVENSRNELAHAGVTPVDSDPVRVELHSNQLAKRWYYVIGWQLASSQGTSTIFDVVVLMDGHVRPVRKTPCGPGSSAPDVVP